MLRSAFVVLACLAAAFGVVRAGTADGDDAWRAKVQVAVIEDTSGRQRANVLVVFREQADLSGARRRSDRPTQGAVAVSALRHAADVQAPVLADLDLRGVSARSLWVVNAIATTGDRNLVEVLARRPEVASIEPDRAAKALVGETGHAVSSAPRGVEWGVAKIGAPDVWALGFTGQGLVYANSDTGVAWEIPALRSRYRGVSGEAVEHAYSWWDAVHEDIDGDGTNACGFNLRAPCDDDVATGISHGTHTMATAVGDDGAGNQVGVAPGAKWIACRSMEAGTGRPSTYLECLQFFLAPTDLEGLNPDPSRRPNVVGNSYACPPDEGCSADTLQLAVENLRSAGVFMAVSTGNEGASCSTVVNPPGHYDAATSVGATDAADRIASFSSRGPVLVDGTGRRKPDVSAPGVGVRSATATGFALGSGTSMAAPHVGGAVVLLWSAVPALRGDVDVTERLLEASAVRLTTTEGCGGDTAASVPNNTFGYGRIDVLAAYRAAQEPAKPTISVADVTTRERNVRTKVSVPVSLSEAAVRPVVVTYAARASSARVGVDFRARAGTLTFPVGTTIGAITLQIVGDTTTEMTESFSVELSDPEGATLGRGRAVVTIRDDDVDRTAPVLRALRIVPTRPVAGRSVGVRLVLSERATVACTLDRRLGTAWNRIGLASGSSRRDNEPWSSGCPGCPREHSACAAPARTVPGIAAGLHS